MLSNQVTRGWSPETSVNTGRGNGTTIQRDYGKGLELSIQGPVPAELCPLRVSVALVTGFPSNQSAKAWSIIHSDLGAGAVMVALRSHSCCYPRGAAPLVWCGLSPLPGKRGREQ